MVEDITLSSFRDLLIREIASAFEKGYYNEFDSSDINFISIIVKDQVETLPLEYKKKIFFDEWCLNHSLKEIIDENDLEFPRNHSTEDFLDHMLKRIYIYCQTEYFIKIP